MGGASVATPMVTGCLDPVNFQSPSAGKSATVVVTEGVPTVPCRLVDKIKKWEFVNMAELLKDNNGKDPQFMVVNGQLVAVHRHSSSKTPLSILQWLKAFNIFMAVLLSSEDTTREKAAGLAAHNYLIIQLANDPPGSQLLQYDQRFCERAAAKGSKKWGELNLTIYGRCLACYQLPTPTGSKREADVPVCFRWNEGALCSKPSCKYSHVCRACGGPHREVKCRRAKEI